ncbi:MAG: hypothetical protein K8T10_05610 [Candidatus Eremiobacteraeota bacterium]|nr:hypothetical protein [Candidatus Eremiobacteraeota bacterium]
MMSDLFLNVRQCISKYSKNRYASSGKEGFTFLEVLISLTVLLVVCLVLFGMFHASLRYSADIKDESIAAVIAERNIEEIRAWAYTFDDGQKMYNFNDENWTPSSPYPFSGYAGADSINSDFNVDIKIRKGGPYYYHDPQNPANDECHLFYPSTGTEKDQMFKRTMDNSMARVQVTVSWNNNQKNFTTVACIAEPTRELDIINISTISSVDPVLSDNTNKYEAQAKDIYNNDINDVQYKWYVEPIDGNGEVVYYPEPDPRPSPTPSINPVTGHDPLLGSGSSAGDAINFPMGKRSVFVHRIKKFDWTPMNPKYTYIDPSGTCKVTARGQSGGVVKSQQEGPINVAK